MSAIMVSQIRVLNPEKFQLYLEKTLPIASKFGAELIFRGALDKELTREAVPHELIVTARFPDLETLHRWHDSPEYQAIIPLREEGSEQTMMAYDEQV